MAAWKGTSWLQKNVLEFLEESVRRFPDQLAFADENEALTYREFSDRARAIGSALARLCTRNAPVAVLLDKSVSCLAGMLGAAYSGNFYVVIDVKMPPERVRAIFERLDPAAVLTDRAHFDAAKEIDGSRRIFLVEEAAQTPADEALLQEIRTRSIDTDPLYALFTSGSTGVPKGAVICHRSVIDYAHWVTETFGITHETVFGSQTPFYFSMSVLDIFATIQNGASMWLIPKQLFSFPLRLLEFLAEKQINTIYWVPSALCLVANWKALGCVPLPMLKKILFAGEVMPAKQLNQWIKFLPDALFANLYGPTEVTDICAYYIVDRPFRDDEPLPIGGACNNCGLLVLTPEGEEAPPDGEGELCVRGSFLALGYYGEPEKTAAAFVQNPRNQNYPELIYRTGDLVRRNERGELVFISRLDFQIKHMGYRIELGEIEAAASGAQGVDACVCVYDGQKDCIILVFQGSTERGKLLDSLKKRLPPYMLPGKAICVKAMPHNANGKIDRTWLRDNYRSLTK